MVGIFSIGWADAVRKYVFNLKLNGLVWIHRNSVQVALIISCANSDYIMWSGLCYLCCLKLVQLALKVTSICSFKNNFFDWLRLTMTWKANVFALISVVNVQSGYCQIDSEGFSVGKSIALRFLRTYIASPLWCKGCLLLIKMCFRHSKTYIIKTTVVISFKKLLLSNNYTIMNASSLFAFVITNQFNKLHFRLKYE